MSRLLLAIVCLWGLTAVGHAQTVDDPMRPPQTAATGGVDTSRETGWVLYSTLVSPQQRSAVINGRSVGIGERVNGARVVDIQPGRATLRGKDGDFVLKLTTATVKTQARP